MGKREREQREVRYTSAKEKAIKHESGFESSAVKAPEGMKFFKAKGGKSYRLDFMPYEVKKGRDEKGGNPHSDAGFAHYERTYYAHPRIGIDQKFYCCPRLTFGERCPVCDDASRLRRIAKNDDEEKFAKSLEAKERQLFIVVDTEEKDGEAMLWDFSFHCFGKQLDAKLKDSDERDNYDAFCRLEGGMTLKVSFADEKGGGYSFAKCSNIEMRPRDMDYPPETLDSMPDLDAMLVYTSYADLKRIYEQTDDDKGQDDDDKPEATARKPLKVAAKAKPKEEPEDDEPEPEKPAPKGHKPKTGKAKPKEEPEEDESPGFKPGDKVKYGDAVYEVLKVSSDGETLTLEDEDGEVEKTTVDEVEKYEEEPEPEPPAKPAKGGKPPAKGGKAKPASSDDDWDD